MDLQQNSDFYFVQESFRLFFEKILGVINDPKGIVVQEWMKYKEQLTAKGATPSSIYCYAHSLVISPQEAKPNNIVKLKRQGSRQEGSGGNTPRKITRRNSFGSESPNQGGSNKAQANTEGGSFTSQVQETEKSSGSNNRIPENTGILSERTNQYSPWVDSDRKKNEQPTQRVNLNEIQQMKGLSEIPSVLKDTKNNEKLTASKKTLLDRVKKCIEQYQKDTVGLDLIHDRSFQTQTMLVDNKRKPYERNIKRQDSKFIRELSIYSKKGAPTGPIQQQPGKELPQGQKDFLKEQQDKFISQRAEEDNKEVKNENANKNNTATTNATFQTPAVNLNYEFDFVKSKHPSEQPHPPVTAAVKNYLPTTPITPAYIPSTNIPTYQGIQQPTVTADNSKKDNIDDLVQKILRDQKEKEKQTSFTTPTSEASKGTVDAAKTTPSQGYTSYSPSTTSIPIPAYNSSPYSYTSSIPTAGIHSSIPSYTSSPYTSSGLSGFSSMPPVIGDIAQTQTTPHSSYTGTPSYSPYGISSLPQTNPSPKQ